MGPAWLLLALALALAVGHLECLDQLYSFCQACMHTAKCVLCVVMKIDAVVVHTRNRDGQDQLFFRYFVLKGNQPCCVDLVLSFPVLIYFPGRRVQNHYTSPLIELFVLF